MSYLTSDERIIYKLQKYVTMLKEPYNKIKDIPEREIDNSTDGWAVTQGITNIHEVVSRIGNKELYKLLIDLQADTRITRNIASHDYEAINWKAVKRVCNSVFSIVTDKLIADCLDICQADKKSESDYTVNSNATPQTCEWNTDQPKMD